MEEVKFVSLFPELNNKYINKTQQNKEVKNIFKIKKNLKKVPINILLNNEDFNFQNKRVETDFFKKKNKFFSPETTNNTRKTPNKTNFFPNLEHKNRTYNRMGKNDNMRIAPKSKENTPMVFKIFDKFDEISRKYDEQTKYYNQLIKKGDNNRKINIKTHSNKSPSLHMVLPKNNCKKRCSYVYKRIKEIQE